MDIQQRFSQIEDRVTRRERLTFDDGCFLFRPEVDLHAIGRLADQVRYHRSANYVYYNINSHLNPTNICQFRCPLCAYSCDADDSRAFVLSQDEILASAQQAFDAGSTEIHIVGGLHPDKSYAWYRDIISILHDAFPRLLLKAWTAAEIDCFAKGQGWSHARVLEDLQSVGVGSLPGGGAEIFTPEVRRVIAPRKADADTWLSVHRTAHQLGMPTTATMLFGHIESPADRVDHMLRLRDLQDETGGFLSFVPLSFHPDGTGLARTHGQLIKKPTSEENLRVIAISRLLLDNFPHIKAYWISLGVGTAQMALGYGADDLDGTVRQELIHHDAGALSPEQLTVDQLSGLIREAGREPIERDTLYRTVQRDGADWMVIKPV